MSPRTPWEKRWSVKDSRIINWKKRSPWKVSWICGQSKVLRIRGRKQKQETDNGRNGRKGRSKDKGEHDPNFTDKKTMFCQI